MAVALVADVGDALDALVAHHIGDLLLKPRLVHLIRQLGDDDGFAVLPYLLHLAARAHQDGAAPARERAACRQLADDHRAGREIRPRHDLCQRVHADRRIVDIGKAGVDHLAQIVRRNVGRHADSDAAGAVDQQIGIARRQDDRLSLGAIVIVLELDRVLVDVFRQLVRDLGTAHFGVAHRRRLIAVDRAEIALTVDQRHAHGEVLRQAHQGVVDRLVAMRVILAHHVADDHRRFAIGLVPVATVLVHRIEDAAMHGLQPVARVGQRSADDDAHRVIEIGAFQLVLDRNAADAAARRRRGRAPFVAQMGVLTGRDSGLKIMPNW